MEKTIYVKENGITRKINANLEEVDKLAKSINNPCSGCNNCYPAKCQKIFDLKKKNISKYDFITDGYQIYDENGELENLAITKCNEFVADEPRKRPTTKEELLDYLRLKENIILYYFNAENMDEARETEASLIKRGHISR